MPRIEDESYRKKENLRFWMGLATLALLAVHLVLQVLHLQEHRRMERQGVFHYHVGSAEKVE